MFAITFKDQTVGYSDVQTEGCVYKISCVCDLPSNGRSRIFVTDGKETLDLGICVPNEGRFVLTKRIPVRRLIQKNLKFTLKPDGIENTVIPIKTGDAFLELDKLEFAKLHMQDGQAQIVIDLAPDRQDSDQNLKCLNKSVYQ